MNIITDIITYFAKFPAREGVLNLFASSTDKTTGYQALKTTITNLPAPLLPSITQMVFSTSEAVLADKLRNMKGFFLLLEYGAVQTASENNAGSRESAINLAVTVGYPHVATNSDVFEESLIMDQCLTLVNTIVQQMITDNEEGVCHMGHFIEGSFKTSPVEPVMLYGNMGFVVNFTKNVNYL